MGNVIKVDFGNNNKPKLVSKAEMAGCRHHTDLVCAVCDPERFEWRTPLWVRLVALAGILAISLCIV